MPDLASIDQSVTCPWCRQFFPARPASGHCTDCGGQLPAPIGSDRGPAPPPPPRKLPDPYRRAVMFSKNPGVIVGLVSTLMGTLFALIGVVAITYSSGSGGVMFTVFGGLFTVLGLFVMRAARAKARQRLDALEHGIGVEGEVTQVAPDTTQSVNGRNPWRIEYVFAVGGSRVGGDVTSWNAADGGRRRGEPVWVVYLDRDTAVSSLWPPLA